MQYVRYILASFVLIVSYMGNLSAQVEVVADGRLQTILEQHILYNSMSKTFAGYRIKVAKFTGDDAKEKSFELKQQLLEIFPSQRVYVVFDEPFFNVKMGDFLTRLDAFALLKQIKPQIPSAVIIQDYVNAPVVSEEDLQAPEYFEEDLESDSDSFD